MNATTARTVTRYQVQYLDLNSGRWMTSKLFGSFMQQWEAEETAEGASIRYDGEVFRTVRRVDTWDASGVRSVITPLSTPAVPLSPAARY